MISSCELTLSSNPTSSLPPLFLFHISTASYLPTMSTLAQEARSLHAPRACGYNSTFHVAHATDFVNHPLPPPASTSSTWLAGRLIRYARRRCRRSLWLRPRSRYRDRDADVGRLTAKDQGTENVAYFHHDITKLSLMSSREGGYDVITCASAVPLLEDPGEAFEQWAAFLILAGAWSSTSNREVPYLRVAFRASRHSCWRCPPWGGLRVTGKEYFKTFVREAGLGVGKRFGSKGYGGAEVWEGSDG